MYRQLACKHLEQAAILDKSCETWLCFHLQALLNLRSPAEPHTSSSHRSEPYDERLDRQDESPSSTPTSQSSSSRIISALTILHTFTENNPYLANGWRLKLEFLLKYYPEFQHSILYAVLSVNS